MPTQRIIHKNADGVVLSEERLYMWLPALVIERSFCVSSTRGPRETVFTSWDWANRYFRHELELRKGRRGGA